MGRPSRGLVPAFAILFELNLLVSHEAAKQGVRSNAAAIVIRLAIVAVAALVRIANVITWLCLRPSPPAETEVILGAGLLKVRIKTVSLRGLSERMAALEARQRGGSS